jgi:hypothetical protein
MGFTSNEVIEINQFLKNENSRNTRISWYNSKLKWHLTKIP